MVTKNEMKEFKRDIKMTAGILIGFAVAFLAMAGIAQLSFAVPKEAPGVGDGMDISQGGQAILSPGEGENFGNETIGEGRKPVQNQEYLLLVNKSNPIDENYKPDDLTEIKYYAKDRDSASRYMRKEAAEQFHKLVEAAKEEGHEIVMTTAYRSYGFQSILYNNYVKAHGEEEANRFSAKPGQSEHQTGLCTDVSSPSVNYKLTTDYADTAEGKWLATHAHEYGFIIRFPLGKEDITGYQYEPWHIRYVGQPAADEIYEQELTLEEYLESI